MTSTPERDRDREARMVLSLLCEPGSATLAALLADRSADEVVHAITRPDAAAEPEDPAVAALLGSARTRLAGRDRQQVLTDARGAARACGARVLVPTDREWPMAVNDLTWLHDESTPDTRPPVCLWVRGRLPVSQTLEKSVSIVGSRDCSAYGRHVAIELGYQLAQQGWTVVSGGAYGIDEAAHRGALAAEGPTVAVMACGVDRPYPAANAQLFARIVRHGLIISEWPPGAIPQRHRFLVRNRVIAAATRGTVVVEAARRSGAKHTARRARELDRTVMIVPGPVTSEHSAGVHELAREPGEARIVTGAADVIADIGAIGEGLTPAPVTPRRPGDGLPPVLGKVWEAVPLHGTAPVSVIAMQAAVPIPETHEALASLSDRGLVERVGSQHRRRPGPDRLPPRQSPKDETDMDVQNRQS